MDAQSGLRSCLIGFGAALIGALASADDTVQFSMTHDGADVVITATALEQAGLDTPLRLPAAPKAAREPAIFTAAVVAIAGDGGLIVSGPIPEELQSAPIHTAADGWSSLDGAAAPDAAPGQVGWAFDGYPVFLRTAPDVSGELTPAKSSYRPGAGGDDAPVFTPRSGDLDACNGRLMRLGPAASDIGYGYVLTDTAPHAPTCFTGTPINGAILTP